MKPSFAFRITLLSSLNLLILCHIDTHDVNSSFEKEIVKGSNEFALKLVQFRASHPDGGEKNFFVSPTSIALALGMVLIGAEKQSAKQITDTLHWSGLERKHIHQGLNMLQKTLHSEVKSDSLQLKLANNVWGNKHVQLKDSFAENIKYIYNSTINLKDFESKLEETRQEINQWVHEQTMGKIDDFFPQGTLTQDTKLALVNGVYFKGLWEYQFNEEKTFRAPFYAHGKHVNEQVVEMMSMTAKFKYFLDDENGCQVLLLPYSGKQVSMLFLLPRELDGLTKFEQTLTAENLERWTTRLIETKVTISLPKFKLRYEMDLKDILPNLGISDIFDASKANLTGVSESEGLFVSSAMHKAYVDVNEKGTEAAAATGVVMRKRSLDMNEVFHVDHPFLFFIYHHPSQSVLFLGRVVQMDDIAMKGQNDSRKRSTDEL